MSAGAISFTVSGNPIPKARPRRGRNGIWYTPQKTRDYERTVYMTAIRVVPWETREAMLAHKGALRVNLRFFRDTYRACDLDNLAKVVSDGLNGILWRDDRQIKKLKASMEVDAQNPRVEIEIEAMG